MKQPSKNASGFTLIEVLVALLIASIAMAAIYGFFISQSKTYTVYTHGVTLQQDLRTTMQLMQKELRLAGYNPGGLSEAAAGEDNIDNNCNGTTDEVDASLTPFINESEAIGIKVALTDRLSFSLDKDGNGKVCGEKERVTYSLNGTTLQRNGSPKLENVDALNFIYLDQNGVIASNIDSVRAVQITIVARTSNPEASYSNPKAYVNLQGDQILAAQNDGYLRMMLSSQTNIRNRAN